MSATMRFDVHAIRLSVQAWSGERNTAPPLLLLPATGKTVEDWEAVAAALSADRTVYAMDLRGHGASDWPGNYRLHEFSTDVLGVVETLMDGEFDLVGHSLGGLVGCLVAASQPKGLRRLVLEDVCFPYQREPAPPARPPGDVPFDWRVVEQVRPQIDNPDSGWGDYVQRIAAPTLLIGGGAESFVPQVQVRELADRIDDARMVTIEAGHLVHATCPGEFSSTVRSFLGTPDTQM